MDFDTKVDIAPVAVAAAAPIPERPRGGRTMQVLFGLEHPSGNKAATAAAFAALPEAEQQKYKDAAKAEAKVQKVAVAEWKKVSCERNERRTPQH